MTKNLGDGDIGKLLIKYSIPTIIGSTIVMLYTIIDRIFIGQKLGATALAGVSLTQPFSQIAVSLGALIGVGGTTLISIKLGENKDNEVGEIIGNQFTLFLLVCTFVTIFQQLFLVQILNKIGANEQTLPYAVSYARIFIPVIFFQCFTYGLNGGIRAHGFPKYAMTTSCIGAFLNIILDYIFLYPLNMGVFGAGLATFISSGLAALFNLNFYFNNKYPVKLKASYFKLKKHLVLRMASIGSSAWVVQMSNAVVMGTFNNQLNKLTGAEGIAAYGIFMTIHSLNIMIIQGIGVGGMQPLIGFNIGAKKYHRVVETIKLTLRYAMGLTVFLMLGIQLFPHYILRIFVDDPRTIEIGTNALRLGFSVLPFMVITILISTMYQALGEAKLAFNFTVLRKLVLVIPVILILPYFIGINGVWLSRPLSDTLAFFIMTWYFKGTYNELKSKIKEVS